MKEEEIQNGDIVEIDYIEEFTKEHINEGKALVLWKGFHNQPLLIRLSQKYNPVWSDYGHIARVVGHIDLDALVVSLKLLRKVDSRDKEDRPELYSRDIDKTVYDKAWELEKKEEEKEPEFVIGEQQ